MHLFIVLILVITSLFLITELFSFALHVITICYVLCVDIVVEGLNGNINLRNGNNLTF